MWDSITAHPQMSPWWEERSAEQTISAQAIQVPILFQTGWWDHNLDFSLAGFQQLRDQSPAGRLAKLVVGPWSHTTSGVSRQGDLEFANARLGDKISIRRFFDRWLRGIDNGIEREGAVSYYQIGRDRWVTAPTWPPESVDRTYYLRSEGGLSVAAPADDSPDRYASDPANPSPSVGGPVAGRAARFPDLILGPAFQDERVLAGRSDYLLYDSPPLDEDLDVVGSVRLQAFIGCDQPDTDVAVRLCDYDPSAPAERRTLLVMTGIRRMRYRQSLTSPGLMQPEVIYQALIEMDPVAHTWRKGHRVRIIVSSSNYPLYAVNPNNGEDFVWQPGTERVASVEVFHDGHHPSTLVLPVLGQPPGEAAGIDHSQTRRQGTDENH
jgi:putative CocE/NonD family hydrolase